MNQERIELLIGRTVDAAETPAEWAELCTLADASPAAWRHLAFQQRQAQLLGEVVAREIEAARVGLPGSPRSDSVAGRIGPERATVAENEQTWSHLLPTRWVGWSVAACIAGAWLLSSLQARHHAATLPEQVAGLSLQDPGAALETYLDRGMKEGIVVGEMPSMVLLDTRPVDTGDGFEVLFLRQIVERRIVPDMYEFTQADELGRPFIVRVSDTRGSAL